MTCKTFTPHPYQQYCINRIVESPTVGLFLDMGLGKTAITLMAIRCLKFDCWAVNRVLVVAPKKVAEATWQNEAATWNRPKGCGWSRCWVRRLIGGGCWLHRQMSTSSTEKTFHGWCRSAGGHGRLIWSYWMKAAALRIPVPIGSVP